jgi:surface protein
MDILSFLLGKNSSGGGGGSKYAPQFATFRNYTGTDLTYETKNLDTSNMTSMATMFYSCTTLTSIDLSNFNTTNVTDMGAMFQGCMSLTEIDASSFITTNVEKFDGMFSSCFGINKIDIRQLTFKNGATINYMFSSVPDNCLIIVKSDTEKTKILNEFSNLTNVKTVSEYEGV